MRIRGYAADIKGTSEPLKSEMILEMKDLEKELAVINAKLITEQVFSEAFVKALEDISKFYESSGDDLIQRMKNIDWEDHFLIFKWDYVYPELFDKMVEILKNK